MKKTNYILIFCILIVAFLGVILTYTYAFPSEDNVYVDSSLVARPIFVTNTDDLVNVNVLFTEDDVLAEDESQIIVSLSNLENTKALCTYDVYYNWHKKSDLYVRENKDVNEFILSGKVLDNVVFSDKQITNVQKQYLYSGSIYNDGSKITNQTINIISKFLNTGLDQTYHYGKNYLGSISIENVMCKSAQNALATSIVKDTTANGIYEDLDSNNYLYFNNELYRIIGLVNENVQIIKESNIKEEKISYGFLDSFDNIVNRQNINWLTDEYQENEVYLLNSDVLFVGLGTQEKPYQIVLKNS